MSRGSWFWKEAGCRQDSSILDGRTKANAEDAAKKRERKGTGYIIPQAGTNVRRRIPEAFRKWEHKARTSKKECKCQRGIVTHPLSESQWKKGPFQCKEVGV